MIVIFTKNMYAARERVVRQERQEKQERKSKRKRMDDYGFLKPVHVTKTDTSSTTMEDIHREYATLCDIAYKRNQTIIEKALQDSELDTVYRYRSDISSSEVRVFESRGLQKTLISAFKSCNTVDENQLDTTLTGDIATDLAFVVAYEKAFKPFKRSLRHWKQLYDSTHSFRHILIGHSLGAAMARHVFDKYSDQVCEIHAFMPRHGLSLMATQQQHYHRKYFTHYMLGDPLQVTGVQADSNTRVYIPQDAVAHSYLLKKLLNTD